eukprot:CAMPEP_0113663160 /NCGR_PEP_ID=MMETSP0038_2-20120614/983_1 /TAXON_ID=2898 /ORGANISM="Cryptomonas paramecium" /LENGTH=203 /DNA_ID=CAMNT_0000578147 /DNA_START=6 /DNA_END=614 /DNA_ORIENTATION=+ /assembly_acc=CAM_ASM_000170
MSVPANPEQKRQERDKLFQLLHLALPEHEKARLKQYAKQTLQDKPPTMRKEEFMRHVLQFAETYQRDLVEGFRRHFQPSLAAAQGPSNVAPQSAAMQQHIQAQQQQAQFTAHQPPIQQIQTQQVPFGHTTPNTIPQQQGNMTAQQFAGVGVQGQAAHHPGVIAVQQQAPMRPVIPHAVAVPAGQVKRPDAPAPGAVLGGAVAA